MGELILCTPYKQYLDPSLIYMIYFVEEETQNQLIVDFADCEECAENKVSYYSRFYTDLTYRLITDDDDF